MNAPSGGAERRWCVPVDWMLGVALLHLALVTAAGFLGAWSWLLDLSSHFRPHYAVAAGVLAAACLLRRRPGRVVAALALLAANGAAMVPSLVATAAAGDDDGDGARMTLVALNLDRDSRETGQVVPFLSDVDADIVVLLELTPQWERVVRTLPSDRFPHRLLAPRLDYSGIGLLSALPWRESHVVDEPGNRHLAVSAAYATAAGPVRILGVHLSHHLALGGSADRLREIRWVAETAHRSPQPMVLAGDLNTTPWSHVWRRLVELAGLRSGGVLTPTWPTALHLAGIPIDHVLGTEGVRVVRTRLGPDVGSDHRPVIAEIVIATRPATAASR